MTSSEKILVGIKEQAQLKADEITKKAQTEATSIIELAKKNAENKSLSIVDDAEKKASLLKSTGTSSALLLKRDKALQTRREAIQKVLNNVVDVINSYDDKEYFDFLYRLIEKSILNDKGILFLNSKDLSKNTSEFSKEIQKYNLTLSDTPVNISGGFILKYGDVEINGEIDALINEKREILVDKVNKTLFN